MPDADYHTEHNILRQFDEQSFHDTATVLNRLEILARPVAEIVGYMKGRAMSHLWPVELGSISRQGFCITVTRWPDGTLYHRAAVEAKDVLKALDRSVLGGQP